MEGKTVPCCEEALVHTGAVERVRASLPPDEQLYDLAELFKIFGDSTRVKILYALLESEGFLTAGNGFSFHVSLLINI